MNNDDSAIGYWKTNLLELQEKAPKPKMVKCCENRAKTIEKPEFYGPEFHGLIAREEAEKVGNWTKFAIHNILATFFCRRRSIFGPSLAAIGWSFDALHFL